ncbi:tetratricopeptide repeat protein [Streptomyces sp. NPDC005551]|uniref:tetratricopeptide repeat protein n=1 Tax=Streptomyces sp. NPDC005551 TaxID=3364725 RepID=UPI0036AE4969
MGDHRGTAPQEASDAVAFVASLRRLKDASGLTYRQLEARAARLGRTLPPSTLAGALNRVSLPRAELVAALVHACGCSDEERRAWLAVHRRLSAGGGLGVRAAAVPRGFARFAAPGSEPAASDRPPRQPHLPVVPAQLPADSSAFTGRLAELQQILSLGPGFRPGQDTTAIAIGVIDGMAGVGKTTLAVHAAHRLAPDFPHGRLFVDLHGCTQGVDPVDPATALASVLRALGLPKEGIPPGLDERAALYRTLLTGTRTLVVLDNAHSESQVIPLLPAAPGSLVLITARRRLIGLPDARHISLGVLPSAEAISVFTHPFTHPSGTGRLAGTTPERLAEVADLCGRLPLALRLAAARLQARPAWTVDDLAVRLARHHDRPAESDNPRRSVHAALDLSYRHLTPEQRRTYRLLGLHPGADLDAHAAAALTGTPVAHTVPLLDDLVDSHLLTEPAPGRYRFHVLIRVHAMTTANAEDTEADRRAALHRLFDHYARTTSAAMDTVYPYDTARCSRGRAAGLSIPFFHGPAEAETWLDTEVENLLAAAAHATPEGRPRHIRHQTAVLHRHLRTRGRCSDAVTRGRSPGGSDRADRPDALIRFGEIHYKLGRYEQGLRCFRQAVDLARATEDRTGELYALFGFGHVHRALGRYPESTDHFSRGLDLARATANRKAELFALIGVGHGHLVLGRQEAAARCFARARDLVGTAGDDLDNLSVLIGWGDLHRPQDRHQEAPIPVEPATRATRGTGDGDDEIEVHAGLGRCHQVSGRHQHALTCHRTALTLATKHAHPGDQARAHDGLAQAYQALGHHDRARDHWRSALAILTLSG